MSVRIRLVALVLAAVILAGLGLLPRVGARVLRNKLATMASRYGARAEVAAVRFGLGRVELYGLRIDGQGADPILYARRASARVSLLQLLLGNVHVQQLLLEEPSIFVARGGPADNITAVLEAYANRAVDPQGAKRSRIDELKIVSGQVELRDRKRGTVVIPHFDVTVRPNERISADVANLHAVSHIGAIVDVAELHAESGLAGRGPIGLPLVRVKDAMLVPFTGLRMGAITGEVGPDSTAPGRAKIDLAGSFGDRTEPLWSARGWIDPLGEQGRLTIFAERFRLGQLKTVMGQRKHAGVDTKGAEVDLRIDVGYVSQIVDFGGRVHLSGLTIENPRLGPKPVTNVGFDATTKGRVELAARKVQLEQLKIDYRAVHASFAANVANVGKLPAFNATATIEPMPCQSVLDALPAELTPFLQGFRVAGTFSTDLHAALDLADLEAPVELGGKVGIEGCRVTSSPSWASAERLSRPFEHTVEYEPGKWMTFAAGPENPDFVPYAEISPHLVNSIMTTEDSGFMKHRGFIPSEFRSALQQNLQRGYFRLGASSITMQMVKNVLLSREKTLSRKLQEMFITWYLEHHLSKQRILEIYFNVIEFGPGIYGIGRAAHHYFGKPASALTPRESAYFSSILPNPKRRYVQFCHASGQVDAKWDSYMKRILRRMHERGRLTDAEFAEAVAAPLQFSRAEAVSERECMAIVKRTTGGPPWPSPR